MHQRLGPAALFFLTLPPLLWAGNAVVGRLVGPLVPPMAFNLMRWSLAFLLLLPFAGRVLRRGSPLWQQWPRFAVLGLLGTSGYNALNYLALHTSSAINVTLVGASTPVWMLLIGRLFFGQRVGARQLLGAALSIVGVLLVLSRGEWAVLAQFRLVPGDFYVLVASVGWAVYCWLLMHPPQEVAALRGDWSGFLVAQIVFGLLWSTLFTTGEQLLDAAPVRWGWPLAGALAYVALGPSIAAYGAFGAGLRRAGPHVSAHFINLTPLFTALLSAVFLNEQPTVYHGLAFVLIILGITLARARAPR